MLLVSVMVSDGGGRGGGRGVGNGSEDGGGPVGSVGFPCVLGEAHCRTTTEKKRTESAAIGGLCIRPADTNIRFVWSWWWWWAREMVGFRMLGGVVAWTQNRLESATISGLCIHPADTNIRLVGGGVVVGGSGGREDRLVFVLQEASSLDQKQSNGKSAAIGGTPQGQRHGVGRLDRSR